MTRKILFLVPYPLQESPSQRFRFEQYFQLLNQEGFDFSVQSFLNSHNWQFFFSNGRAGQKLVALLSGYTKRFSALLKAPFYDFIFVHREITPLGPPVFEWIIARVFRKKIIYDFDDAIWSTDRVNESWLLRTAKWRSKVSSICKWSYRVSCGNEYLCDYARKFNNQVVYNPTTLDTVNKHNPDLYRKKAAGEKIVIGWTGSHSTLKYLSALEPVLQRIENTFPTLEVWIIADKKPSLALKNMVYIPWRESTEAEDLLQIDIGIMPLPDDEWSKGKCGFKALQYLALNLPAVASPVGVNTQIIEHGKNGYLCFSPEAWEHALTTLILDPQKRKKLGEQGRKKVVSYFSVVSNSSNFLSLFK